MKYEKKIDVTDLMIFGKCITNDKEKHLRTSYIEVLVAILNGSHLKNTKFQHNTLFLLVCNLRLYSCLYAFTTTLQIIGI